MLQLGRLPVLPVPITPIVAALITQCLLLTGPAVLSAAQDATEKHAAGAIVASSAASLWEKPKAKGPPLAVLEQGLAVVVLPEGKKGKLAKVKTTEPFAVEGWIASSDLGCRLTRETALKSKMVDATDVGAAGWEPLVRKGALVKVLKKQKDGWLLVETAPYPIKIFRISDSDPHHTIQETVFTGAVVQGWIPAELCSPHEGPYYDATPQEGTLLSLSEETFIVPQPLDEAEGASPKGRRPKEEHRTGLFPRKGVGGLPASLALKYCRWVELEVKRGWSRGYTDGPVVVRGWVRKDLLGPLPNTNPLNAIFIKDLKDCEVISSTSMRNPKDQRELTILPGGLEVYKIGVDFDGCLIKTPPPITIVGMVDCKFLRSLSLFPERAIDATKGGGQVTFPERGPKLRK